MKTKLFFKAAIALLFILVAFTPEQSAAQGVKVIVIDPGHGGVFPGAHYKGVDEKYLNLKVALKLGALIKKNHPNIKVVYTRTTDKHLSTKLSTDLGARSKIANDAMGDLFISIHANAASNASANGAECIIMGESSLEKQRNDAALYTANKGHLIDMSDAKNAAIVRAKIQNLQFTYGQYSEAIARLITKSYEADGRDIRALRRQPIMVLYTTDMPCVLTEMGFMSNAKEFAFLNSDRGQNHVANSIYKGINEYIKMVGRTVGSNPAVAPAKEVQSKSSKPQTATNSGYTIQIFSSSRPLQPRDRQFKSYASQQWMKMGSGKYKYKYCVGRYTSKSEAERALTKVKRSFKDAFVTTF